MSVTYAHIERDVAFKAGVLRGPQVGGIGSSYATPLVASALDGSVPLAAIRAAVLQAEERIVRAVCAAPADHPWRASLAGLTAPLAHHDALPATDSTNRQILGAWGAVFDAADGRECARRPHQIILRRVANVANFWKIGVYWYDFVGGRIVHTRPSVRIRCCSYDRAAQAAAQAAASPMLLPDAAEDALVTLAASLLTAQAAERFGPISQSALAEIARGGGGGGGGS